MRRSKAIAAGLGLALLVGCATRTAPPLPASLAHPEFMYPVVPAGTGSLEESAAVDRGWRFLQNDDLGNAQREFAALPGRGAVSIPGGTGSAYVALAGDDYGRALEAFDSVLVLSPKYVPALSPRSFTPTR